MRLDTPHNNHANLPALEASSPTLVRCPGRFIYGNGDLADGPVWGQIGRGGACLALAAFFARRVAQRPGVVQ